MKLLIVESPSKAKTLKNYLSSDYEVIASVGHFRDLPKSGIGIEENSSFKVSNWEVDNEKINPVLKLIRKSSDIFLATDPDREGELISWHILELCKEKNLLKSKNFSRVEFNQVNKKTVLDAINNPREINTNLVNAALARRFLDRFFGYKISPITQRRTIFGKSAGRVQSPALRILTEREQEIDIFKPDEYWDIIVQLKNKNKDIIDFKVFENQNTKVQKFSIKTKSQSEEISNRINNSRFTVDSIEKKKKKRKPNAPFSTSTLQQEASNKLNFSPALTNTIAQQLFDGSSKTGGLITYIRTDSVSLPDSIIEKCRNLISKNYGDKYLPQEINFYKTKAKNAQEAHEPIRPTNLEQTPEKVKDLLNDNQSKLYELIWKRTIASQMQSSISEETVVFIKTNEMVLRTSGTVEVFDGFKLIYKDNKDNEANILPRLELKETLELEKIIQNQCFTKPPNRFSEAGLIKKLEELGIGRPSTYASIILKLKQKNYVEIKNKTLIPNSKGKILSKFLQNFFTDFVEYEFTAKLEEQLDLITVNSVEWKNVLNEFLINLNETVKKVEKSSITDVINIINTHSKEFLNKEKCPKCGIGDLTIKFAFTGPFIGCSNYSKTENGCKYTSSMDDSDLDDKLIDGEKFLGNHPEFNMPVKIKKGKYGLYIELEKEDGKPKRSGIPKNTVIEDIDLEKAVDLLKLPREIGIYPENGKAITASIGPYGPYLKYNNKFISLKDYDVLEINNNKAIDIIKNWEIENKDYDLGTDPKTSKTIILKKGRYGRFLELTNKLGKTERISVNKSLKPQDINLQKAIEIINGKTKKSQKKKNKKKIS